LDFTDSKRFLYYDPPVTPHNNRQFISGKELEQEEFLKDKELEQRGFLPEDVYSQALNALVIGCVDIIPVHNGHMLIGLRKWQPQPNWWCFGGRMQKGELYQTTAARKIKRELFSHVDDIEINPNRFTLIDIYNLIWDKCAQVPVENGCHVISVTMMLSLTNKEVTHLHPNEEYHSIRWIRPSEIIRESERYHPCLVQMVKDMTNLTDPLYPKT
jgi:hypothetical protein